MVGNIYAQLLIVGTFLLIPINLSANILGWVQLNLTGLISPYTFKLQRHCGYMVKLLECIPVRHRLSSPLFLTQFQFVIHLVVKI